MLSALCLFGFGTVQPPKVLLAKPAPELDALFRRADGWIGADGDYSVTIGKGKVLWLFSDTWVGKVRDGHRVEASMVNNTIGVQASAKAPAEFYLRKTEEGKAVSQIVPSEGHGWFWLQSGCYAGGTLFQFLNEVEHTDDKGVFSFRSTGLWLGVTPNPNDDPNTWQTKQIRLTNTLFQPDRTLVWGASSMIDGNWAYIYGTDEHRKDGQIDRSMTLARVPKTMVDDVSRWEYFDGKVWAKSFAAAAPLADQIATEYSVARFGRGYLEVTTENGLSPKIVGRYAEHPWGPWSTAATLYTCPEMGTTKNVFTYAAKAHPSLSAGDEVVVTYAVNSFDFWEVARNADLYWPKFVRLRLAKP